MGDMERSGEMDETYEPEVRENTQSALPVLANDQLLQIAEAAEKRIEAIKKIKILALKVTNAQDWVDESGKPYPMASGSEKVARLFGISWRAGEPTITHSADGHFDVLYKGEFLMGFPPVSVEIIGGRGSRDPFFSRAHGQDIPPSEIDRVNVVKAAYTNWIGNGVTRILGLRNLTWEDLAEAGIDRSKVNSVERKGAAMSEEAKDQKAEIRQMVLEMAGGDETGAKRLLVQMTTFQGKDGRTVQGKQSVDQLSEKAVGVTHTKAREAFEKWKKDNQVV